MYKIFLKNYSDVSGNRLDPLFYGLDLEKFSTINNEFLPLKKLVLNLIAGQGAGRQDQVSCNEGIIQIRPTNMGRQGELKFEKNVYVSPSLGHRLLKKKDVLFNNTNSQELVGKTVLFDLDIPMTFSNHITVIKVNEEILLPEYLVLILNIYQKNKIFYSICTNWNNQSGVGLDVLLNLRIPIISLEKQKKIIEKYSNAMSCYNSKTDRALEKLDSIDLYLLKNLNIDIPKENISLEQRMFIRNYKEVMESRWDSYFHQKHFISFHEELNKSNYPVISLKNLSIKITSGITPKSGGDAYTSSDEGVPFIRSGDININGKIDYSNLLYIKDEIHNKEMKSSKLQKNDLMIAIVGATIGQVGIYLDDGEANINQAIALVRLKENLNPLFFKELIKSSVGQWNLNHLKRPVARANINLEEISTMRLIVPPLDIQNEIVEHIQRIRNEAKKLEDEANQVLENVKQEIEKMILG